MADIVDKLERIRSLVDGHSFNAQNATDIIDEAAAEILRLRSLLEWRPIETAPALDNTIVLTFQPKNAPGYQIKMRKSDGDFWRTMKVGPTHWLPLPSPPQGEGK